MERLSRASSSTRCVGSQPADSPSELTEPVLTPAGSSETKKNVS
jgi:hypothetical protein